MKQSVAILDFGTSKITVLIGSRGINNSICIDGIGVCEYAGFSGGVWLDPERLQSAIVSAISSAENSARVTVDKLYVGVPNDFSTCVVNDVSISLNRRRRVTEQDVEVLLDSGNKYKADLDWSVINIQAVHFSLDDEHKLVAPVGLMSTRLSGSISYMLAKREFIDIVTTAVNSADVPEVEYVSASLAEILFLFDDYTRDKCVMLADIGALGTALTIGRGDGLCRQYYFSWGGARITAALAELFDISMREAERLKHKVVLSLEPDYVPPENDPSVIMQTTYNVEIDNEVHSYGVTDVNNAVRLEIERLARYIEKALKGCDYEYPEFVPLSITGGGLNYIRGASEYLSECLHREVVAVKPQLPTLTRPQLSAPLGLMDMVLSNTDTSISMIGKIKRWFKR
ncbi:MAG: hypothetical protein HDT28_06050 [Clostridiales bacterium]|nr:hypothetical protein [Clostridiales bacterium]